MDAYADEVLIVGVEKDYDCLCLGEDKTSKQKRLLAKGKAQSKEKEPIEGEPGKSLEISVVDVTCIEDSAATVDLATKPNSTQSPSPEIQSQDERAQSATMQQFPHQPLAGSVYSHSPQPVGRGAATTPNNIERTQPAPTTDQLAPCEIQGLTQIGEAASTSQPRDGDIGWITSTEWDAFFNQQPFTPDADPQNHAPTTNQHSNNSMMSKGTSTGSAAALFGSGSSAGGGGGTSSLNASGAGSGPGAGFGSFADVMEKDSAAQSTSHYVPAASSITSTNSAPLQNSLFNSTSYPASNATPNANQNQNSMTSFNPPSAAQSNYSNATNHHAPTASNTHTNLNLPKVPEQPANAIHAQNYQQQRTQGYTSATVAGTSLPKNQAPLAQIQQTVSNGSGVQGQLQCYSAVNNTTPSGPCQPPVNSNGSTSFYVSNPAQMPLQGTQLPSGNAQQPLFNNGAGAQMMFAQNKLQGFGDRFAGVPSGRPQLPLGNSAHPLPLSTSHLQNDELLARKLQEEEYIRGMRKSTHGDERLAMNLLASDLSIQQARHRVPNVTQYPQHQQQQFPPPSATQMQTVAGPSNFSTNANPGQQNATVLSNASKVLGGEQQGQGPGESETTMKHPTCWSLCPNCPGDITRKYHLIDVEQGSPEWNVVSQPLFSSGFSVAQVQRIQNETLWQRLCFEKQLMLRDRPSCNEKFLYHTSRAEVAVICEEGLDPRLSRNGLFGSGIYFR